MPKGIGFTPVSSNPFPIGVAGIWAQDLGGGTSALAIAKADGSSVALQKTVEMISGENAYLARTKLNATGATIPAGSAIYIKNDGTIGLADANDEAAATFFGIAPQAIPNNTSGKVIYQGVVEGVLTGTGLTTGSYVWLSTTPGGLTAAPPTLPGSHLRIIGIVDGNDLILQQQFNGTLA